MRRILLLILVATALPFSQGVAAPEDFAVQLRQAGGKPQAGATVQVQVEVRWEGRPELHAPSVPELALPAGATQSLGRTGSDFDGQGTRWWSNVEVVLPDRAGPWTLGPAVVLVRSRGGVEKLSSAPLELGRRAALRGLLGQGVGSGLVVLFVVGWIGTRMRVLAREEAPSEQPGAQARAFLARANGVSGEEAWEFLIQARLALPADSVDNANLPPLEQLQERLERSRFGGESIADLECRELGRILEDLLET